MAATSTRSGLPCPYHLPAVILLPLLLSPLSLITTTAAQQHTNTYPEEVHRMVMERLQQREHGRGGTWGEWSAWTPCSRSCGGGVSIQSRECLMSNRRNRMRTRRRSSMSYSRSGSKCVGLYRRFQLCNTQSCGLGYVDFRREQCASFNKTPFNRRFYTWEPYYDTPESCALNCRAVGLSFYATLNRTVIDGTRCGVPDANRICVAGRCMAVGCDGLLGSGMQLDSCGVCGGDNSTCRVIAGIFSNPKMPYGYNMIATLPRGAANITIQQVKPSANYLALRHQGGEFFLNGNWMANVSGHYYSAGTAFTYQRSDYFTGDMVTAKGPLHQPVDVILFYQSVNQGIKYEYRLPMDPTSSKRLLAVVPGSPQRSRVSDNPLNPLVPGGPASRTPPSGPVNDAHSPGGNSIQSSAWWREQQEEERKKKKEARGKKRNKKGKNKGKSRRKRYEWKVAGFNSCSETCGGGSQTTRVVCIKRKRGNEVPTSFCNNLPRPAEETVRCNLRPCPPTWMPGEWGPCSVTCGLGVQTRSFTCLVRLSSDQHVTEPEGACLTPSTLAKAQVCEMPACNAAPAWEAGPWGTCSSQCGLGTRHREVTCKTPEGQVPDHRCEVRSKPSNQELCDMGSCATDTWFFSAWEDRCSEECGEGVQRRRVQCSGDAFDNQVKENTCDSEQRPTTTRTCTSDRGCGGKWFTGPWGECNAECGDGHRLRAVVCVVFQGRWRVTNDQTRCKGHLRPDTSEPCNVTCSQQWYTSEWSQCSVSCGSGVQRREVKCLNAQLEPALGCTSASKPDTRQPCNTQSCHEEQADESVGNTSRSEPPQQTAPSLPGDSSADHRPSGNVESEAGWRPPPQFLEAATTGFASLEAHREPDREAEKNPEQDLSTVDENVAEEEEKEVESVKDSSSRSTSRRRTHPPLSPYRPGRPWRPGLPTGSTGSCMDRMKNCHLVFKARLCRLKYYNKLCCETCTKDQ